MAVWEHPELISGTSPQVATGAMKPELGIVIIHTGTVSTEWSLRLAHVFLNLHENRIPFAYFLNRNQPYDTARELATRGALSQGVKYIFSVDTDVLIPANTVPLMIQWMEQFDKPVLSGLYWAKKPGPQMPAAWVKTGEKPEENRIEFMPIPDVKSRVGTGAIMQCDVVGAGCLLVKADVFKKLDESNPNKPFFQWGLARKDKEGKPLLQVSEDFYFCTRVIQELGIHPFLCTSIPCDHVCDTVIRRGNDGEFEIPMRM